MLTCAILSVVAPSFPITVRTKDYISSALLSTFFIDSFQSKLDNEKLTFSLLQLKDTAERIKAVDHAASMIEEILKQGQVPEAIQSYRQVSPSYLSLFNLII